VPKAAAAPRRPRSSPRLKPAAVIGGFLRAIRPGRRRKHRPGCGQGFTKARLRHVVPAGDGFRGPGATALPRAAPASPRATRAVAKRPSAVPVPVRTLRNRVDPDLFFPVAPPPSPRRRSAARWPGDRATRVLQVTSAVHLGAGISPRRSGRPVTFPQYTPDNTAFRSTLCGAGASGDAAIAPCGGAGARIKLRRTAPRSGGSPARGSVGGVRDHPASRRLRRGRSEANRQRSAGPRRALIIKIPTGRIRWWR